MGKVDLTGKKFGRLTVVSKHEEKLYKEIAWVCKCECGNQTLATTNQLLKSRKMSCGCLWKKSPGNVNDLTGKKFGKLTVLKRDGKTKNDNALWLCRCDCGNEVTARGTSLRRGEIVSCGCSKNEQIQHARKVLTKDKTVDGVIVPLLTKKVRKDSRTGHKGVHRRIRRGKEKYEVSITIRGKRKYIGTYHKLEDAIKARKQAEKEYHEPYIKALEENEND